MAIQLGGGPLPHVCDSDGVSVVQPHGSDGAVTTVTIGIFLKAIGKSFLRRAIEISSITRA